MTTAGYRAAMDQQAQNAIYATRTRYVSLLDLRDRAPATAREFLATKATEARSEYEAACHAVDICCDLDCWDTADEGQAYCPRHGKR